VAGPRGSWTRRQTFDAGSNRLVTTDAGCRDEPSFVVPHDARGQITALAHLPEIQWDHAGRLIGAVLAGAAGDAAFYAYDAAGQRARKVLERGGQPRCTRLYVGDYELFLDHASGASPASRETLHVADAVERLAILEGWTEGGTNERRVRFQLSSP